MEKHEILERLHNWFNDWRARKMNLVIEMLLIKA